MFGQGLVMLLWDKSSCKMKTLRLCQPPLRDLGIEATLQHTSLSQKSVILICIHFRSWSRANSHIQKLAFPQRYQYATHYITRTRTNTFIL